MATVYWTDGAANGDASDTANYDIAALPSSGDTLIIARGVRSITAGLAALAAINLVALQITPGFRGETIGTDSTPLSIQVNSGGSPKLSFEGHPALKYAKFTGTVAKATVDGTGAGYFMISGGTTTDFQMGKSGLGIVDANGTATNIRVGGTAKVVVNPAGTGSTVTLAYVGGGGELHTARSVATAYIAGKAYTLPNGTAIIGTTKAWVLSGGMLNHKSRGTPIAALEVWPFGTFTPEGAEQSFTVSSLIRWARSVVLRQAGAVVVTYTAEEPIGGDVVGLPGFGGGGSNGP